MKVGLGLSDTEKNNNLELLADVAKRHVLAVR